MTEAAIFTIGRSRIIGYGKIRPLADYRSQSRLLNLKYIYIYLGLSNSINFWQKHVKIWVNLNFCMVLSEIDKLFLSQASFQRRSQRKDTILRIFLTIFCETIGLIVSQKSSAAKAEGRLPKSFGFGRLCSASVIVCRHDAIRLNYDIHVNLHFRSFLCMKVRWKNIFWSVRIFRIFMSI